MSDALTESAARLFAVHGGAEVLKAADAGIWPAALWAAVEEAGFGAALLPEAAGGFGGTVQEAMGLVRVAAGHAAPIPLAETMLAGWLLAQAGIEVGSGPATIGPVRAEDRIEAVREGAGWRVRGTVRRVPWGRMARLVVMVEAQGGSVVVDLGVKAGEVTQGANLAGEPRDTVVIDRIVAAEAVGPGGAGVATLRAAGAALRTNQIAGALGRVLALTSGYVQTRVQFGRALGKFQAVQQSMAVLAGQAAAAQAAADLAADAFAAGMCPVVIGAAKGRAGEAASVAAGIAHQMHGAIGFTQEYELQRLTRRLWSWRDEFGNESEWFRVVGHAAFAAGADGLWPMMTAA